MPENSGVISRRSLLGGAAAAFTVVQPHLVRGAGKEKLRAGLVGCGGRGTQAVVDMLTGNENVELVAMGDLFEDHLEGSLRQLRDPKYVVRHAGITVERDGQPKTMTAEDLVASIHPRIKVEPDHHFVGFEAYKKIAAADVDIVCRLLLEKKKDTRLTRTHLTAAAAVIALETTRGTPEPTVAVSDHIYRAQ